MLDWSGAADISTPHIGRSSKAKNASRNVARQQNVGMGRPKKFKPEKLHVEHAPASERSERLDYKLHDPLRCGSLCTGLHSLSFADIGTRRREYIFCAEKDKNLRKFIAKNHRVKAIHSDCTTRSFIKKTHDTELDILDAGFPCQPWSVAGKNEGEKDEHNLTSHILRIVKTKKPPQNRALGERKGAGNNPQGLLSEDLEVLAQHERGRWQASLRSLFKAYK